jgi:hypothetical protein
LLGDACFLLERRPASGGKGASETPRLAGMSAGLRIGVNFNDNLSQKVFDREDADPPKASSNLAFTPF